LIEIHNYYSSEIENISEKFIILLNFFYLGGLKYWGV